MVKVVEAVTAVVAPVAASLDIDLVDVEHNGGIVRLVADEPGGISLDRIAEFTRAASRALDEADPVPGHYTLEVSSPGLERPLRTPTHFVRAVGQQVAVRRRGNFPGDRRVAGTLVAADDEQFVVRTDGGEVAVTYGDVDRARTVVDWSPAPKPGKAKRAAGAAGPGPREQDGDGGAATGAGASVGGRADLGHEGQEVR